MQYGIAFTPLVPSLVLWLAFAAIAVTPAATASATAETPDVVHDLAVSGAHLLAEESELLTLAGATA